MRVVGLAKGLLLGAGLARGQYLVNELSFGLDGKISPSGSGLIPNFHLHGSPQLPEILSNKVVLTPVAPGNQRAALWADRPLEHTVWTTDFEFRANGPERGGGNLCLWLVRGGGSEVGTNSIYTVGKFDGLALVIDAYGGSAGMIRGFLNDGATDFFHLHNIDARAFGHCDYAYRNLGRPSQLKLRQTERTFRVEIDGRLCFETDKVNIPQGYQFGVTAGTPDTPDSFEVFKLMVMTDALHPAHTYTQQQGEAAQQPIAGQQQQQQQQQQEKPRSPMGGVRTSELVKDDPFDGAIPDENAEAITSSKAQFADLHNRLQSVNHHISTIFRSVAKHAQMGETRHAETSKMLDDIKREFSRLDGVVELQRRVEGLEREVRALRSDLMGQVKNSEHSLKGFMSDHHATLSDNIASNAPSGHGRLILVIVASQVILAGGYVLYKRRRNGSHKKYL